MENLSQQEWKERLAKDQNAVIIDVRTSAEIEMGYIPDALHINIMDAGSFMQKTAQLDKSKNYFIYCRAGSRSAQACMIMNSLGFSNTFNLEGGFEKWSGETTL